MIRQTMTYVAVFLLTLYCFFLYDDTILAAMLVVEIFYLLLSGLWLYRIRNKIDFRLKPLTPIAEKNQEIPIILQVKNQSKKPSVHFKTVIQVENSFTGEKKKLVCAGNVSKNEMLSVTSILKADRPGNLKISLKKCFVYDMLCILKWEPLEKINQYAKESQVVSILPQCHLVSVELTGKTRDFVTDATEYSDQESGDDVSEIYQIREYRAGDSLRDIHWKLSAKTDEFMVKEHGRPLGAAVLVWLDLSMDEKSKDGVADTVLDVVASLSMSLLEAGCAHIVSWYEVENRRIQKEHVSKEEHIYELLMRLLYTRPYVGAIESLFEETFREMSFSTIVKIRGDGQVFVNEEKKFLIPNREEDIFWDKMYFII